MLELEEAVQDIRVSREEKGAQGARECQRSRENEIYTTYRSNITYEGTPLMDAT